MRALKKKILSLIMVLILMLATAIASSCANNHPIDESQLPKLDEKTEQQQKEQQNNQQQSEQQAQQEAQQQQEQQADQSQSNSNSNQNSGSTNSGSSSSGGESSTGGGQSSEPLISEAQAISIVLKKVPGAGKEHIASFGRDYDDGRWIYEGEIIYNGLEYDFEIDAMTGNILEWEIDD